MDFGIGFLSNNVMLPILDFFYGIVPSYGLAIVALTLVVRFAVYPLSAGSIRNMRRMKVVQPIMQKRMQEIQQKYKDNPAEQQKAMAEVYREFGNPLAGCFPLLLQLPILFALFATLRGSPFADVNYQINLQIVPPDQTVLAQPFATKPQNIYVDEGIHFPIQAVVPSGTKIPVGQTVHLQFQTKDGKPFRELAAAYPNSHLQPKWQIIRGQERATIDGEGHLQALQPGDVTVQGTIPGIAADKGFLFISALGHVGAIDQGELFLTLPDGTRQFNWGAIHWDILVMILGFGVSLYVNQLLSGQGSSNNPQQQTVNQLTPIIFSGMFLFFPLPAGVLLYMLIANIFQTVQTFILQQEPLPENLQKLVEEQERAEAIKNRAALPFEGKGAKSAKATKAKRNPSS